MTKCLYVGNLPHECTEAELRELFTGETEAPEAVTIVHDHRNGRSRGFGFVEMPSEEAAAAALDALKGRQLGGRELKLGTAHKDKRDNGPRHTGFEDRGDYRPRRGKGRRKW